MGQNKQFRSRLAACVCPANPSLATETLFDAGYAEGDHSPIDQCLQRLRQINQMVLPPDRFDSYHAQLMLLGVVAAVESFLRTLFRRLIFFDDLCRRSAESAEVSYGAALHLSKDLLPEAILERKSLANGKAIEEALRELLAVKGQLPPEVQSALADYERVCHLRHCAVHRFGKLGTRNAIAFGLDTHKALLEKPLALNYIALQNCIAISTTLAKILNNLLFNEILSRVPVESWTGHFRRDRRRFHRIYSLFVDTESSRKSPPLELMYRDFIAQRGAWQKHNNGA